MDLPTPASALIARFHRDLGALAGDKPGRLGIAVSGGPDSLSLLLLAAGAFPGAIRAATVDHQLRPESAAEAAFVADLCTALGVAHSTLRPSAPIGGSLQAEARRVRYALLEDWRERDGLDWLLTAHHLDDQVETVLMRLNRGAGVAGLSGVRAVNGRVLRPLLGWRRAELAGIVEAARLSAVDDSSNADRRFDRVRMRQALAESDWLDPGPIARSAAALAEAEDALAWMTDNLLESRVVREADTILFDASGIPPELRRRLVLAILARLGATSLPRGDEVSRLLAALDLGATATLAGIKCSGGSRWRFEAAPPRRFT
jgi:tRNA(Ile)-lysidine synthase